MIDEAEVEKIARLARISLSSEEKTRFAGDIGKILEYVSSLKSSSGEAEAEGSTLEVNIFREDGIPHAAGVFTEAILAEAPEREGNFVKVKKIL